jgi:hypothetical protein
MILELNDVLDQPLESGFGIGHAQWGADNAANGLYAVQITRLDGVNSPGSGVAVFRDGILLGGDPFFFYTGSYSCNNRRIEGELVNNRHTPYSGYAPVFHQGHKTSLRFSGMYGGDGAKLSGVANVGRKTVTIELSIKKLVGA